MTRLLGAIVLVASLVSAGCARVDLAADLSVTNVLSGYYHVGIVDGEFNKMVPSVTFALANGGDQTISRVQLLVSFWQVGADGEIDSKQVEGIGPDGLSPASSTESILVRSDYGYTLGTVQPKEDMFVNGMFVDFVVKLFARSQGTLIPLGEFPIEHRIIPSAAPASMGTPSTELPSASVAPEAASE